MSKSNPYVDYPISSTYGVKHSRAKVTEGQVTEIRQRFAAGESRCELAHEFLLTKSAVSDIIRRKTWRRIR